MKRLILNAIRSFKTNKMSIIGLVFLVFFGLGAFVTMSNTTANIKNEYTSISTKGNMHDVTAAEMYNVGSAGFMPKTKGISFNPDQTTSGSGEYKKYSVEEFIKCKGLSVNDLWTGSTYPQTKKSSNEPYYLSIPDQEIKELKDSEGKTFYSCIRTYNSIVLDENLSTGLYKSFAQTKKDTSYTVFTLKITNTYQEKTEIPESFNKLQTLLDNWSSATSTQMSDVFGDNFFAKDNQKFNEFISDKTQFVYSNMTTMDTPLSTFLKQDKYVNDIDQRYFKSLNVTATKDNIFYKIIDSNIEDKIDTMVLFKDDNNRTGNSLFSVNDWAPYNSEISFVDLSGKVIEPGKDYQSFKIPSNFNDVATTPLFTHEQISDEKWSEEKKFAYSQIMQIRFKRMLAGKRSTTKLDDQLKLLASIASKPNDYFKAFYADGQTKDAYTDYVDRWFTNYSESITISANGNVVFSWVETFGTPQTCTLSNWTGRFSIVNPQHLSANGKRVVDPSVLTNFLPFNAWYAATYGEKYSGEINQAIAKQWLNTLTVDQINFWINPNSMQETSMVYNNIPGGSVTVKRGTKDGEWNGIDSKSMASCGGYEQVIWGCGITPDFMYPIVDISRPTPNLKTECLVYCNDAGYNTIKLAFVNSPVEEYLVGKFKSNVSQSRKNEILADMNEFGRNNMILPKDVKCAYFADDSTNVLNCSGFRVAYIPNLVRTIDIVSIILCSFIGILAFVICFVIIKRYVERNRINIGIMRANGISKGKIALSLFPFALLPAIIGGVGAYIIGWALQAPALSLFSNYWTLPTPLVGFDWLSLVVCILFPFLLFALICFLATMVVLRTKAVELMKSGSEFKANGFSRVVKKPFKYFGIMTRFRVSLAFNSLSRLIMMALMSCLTMTSLVFAFTTFDKLNQSKQINSSQFGYNFSLKLTTPTASGSTYNAYDYSSFGQTNPKDHLYNINWDTYAPGAVDHTDLSYSELTRWYAVSSDESIKIINKNGNLMLPSASDMTGQNIDLMYLADKTSSKFTLDYNMGASILGISSNPWEIALALMPANSRNLAADSFNKVISILGKNIEEANAVFEKEYPADEQGHRLDEAKAKAAKEKAGKWCYVEKENIGTILFPEYNYYNPLPQYIVNEGTKENPSYKLTKHDWLAGFDTAFVYLIVTAYTDSNIVKEEYPISYRQIPLNWDWDVVGTLRDETYTYIDAKINSVSSKAKIDNSSTSTIEGIVKDSNFIKLTDNNGNDLNKYLFDENYLASLNANGDEYPIIINAYASHKYRLKVGDTINITATNVVDRYDAKIHPEKYDSSLGKATFKVVGISAGTNGEAFYTTQNIANNILGLPNGKKWNRTHRYMRWQSSDDYYAGKPVELVDLGGYGGYKDYITRYSFTNPGDVTKPIVDYEIEKHNYNVPVGFNGIYTQNKSGKPLVNGLSLYSYTGMYPGTSVYKTKGTQNKFAEILMNGSNLSIANLMSCIDDAKYYKACNEYLKIAYPSEEEKAAYRKVVDEFIDKLATIYGETTMVTAINGAMDVAASDLIYTNLISTFDLAQSSIMAIIIPITIIIVGIISNLIIIDSKKMAAMLKALGYSDRKNLMSILALFIPTICIGLALAVPLTFGVLAGYQSLIFTSANILVDISQQWWYYLAAVGGIGIILMAAYAIGYSSLKRDRLVDQIK